LCCEHVEHPAKCLKSVVGWKQSMVCTLRTALRTAVGRTQKITPDINNLYPLLNINGAISRRKMRWMGRIGRMEETISPK
jgi:hypothetical protein